MSTARILITGVGGFAAAHLTRRIAQEGRATAWGVGQATPPPQIEGLLGGYWRADICDEAALRRVIAEVAPTAIVHLAALSSAAQSFQDPIETYRVNALGTHVLLEATRAAAPGARVLVVGTADVYGPVAESSRASEGDPFRPVSPYGVSKAAADAIAEFYSRRGLDVVRTRSFGHIGPGQTDRFVVPTLARQVAEAESGRSEPVVRTGNLEVTRDLTDVRDVVAAYLALLERGRSGAVYNVCRGEGTRLVDVARSLIGRARVPVRIELDPARMRPADIPRLVGDPSAIGRDLGWKAEIPLERTLSEILEEWRGRTGEAPPRRV